MVSQHILHDCTASEYKPHAACLIRPRTIVQNLLPSYLLSAEVLFLKPCHLQIVQSEKAIVPNEAHFLLIER